MSSTATMRAVARRARVSLATVSYVINEGPRPVSDDLRDRVLAAMEELGYQRTRRGRRRTRPLVIGLMVPDANNLFFARAIASIETIPSASKAPATSISRRRVCSAALRRRRTAGFGVL